MSFVVGVRLVALEHRELGVVLGRHALVAEDPSDLEHLVDASDDEPLEVELEGDPEIHVDVEGVVVGEERRGKRSPGLVLQHRRLDLDVAAILEGPPQAA